MSHFEMHFFVTDKFIFVLFSLVKLTLSVWMKMSQSLMKTGTNQKILKSPCQFDSKVVSIKILLPNCEMFFIILFQENRTEIIFQGKQKRFSYAVAITFLFTCTINNVSVPFLIFEIGLSLSNFTGNIRAVRWALLYLLAVKEMLQRYVYTSILQR